MKPSSRKWLTRRADAPDPRAHPLIHFLHVHMVTENISRTELAERAGVSRTMLEDWWANRTSGGKEGQRRIYMDSLENCLGVFGYALKAAPIHKPEGAPK